jgi:prepilin-type N-terminal cleavage/methylation domain-containing protein
MKKRAFTLIELLTVMAISSILLGLIVIPLVQSFNLTRAAQAFADAQDRARIVTERIAREVGGAVSVRSLSGQLQTTVNGVAGVKLPMHTLLVEVPGANGQPTEVALPYAKLDIVPPAEGDPGLRRNGAYVDPNTGIADPTLSTPKGQVILPVAPGQLIRRYFIGRRNPFADYNNPYDGILMARNSNQDNLYVLYAADVNPFETQNVGGTVRLKYFFEQLDGSGNPDVSKPILDDPRFFIPNRDGAGNIIKTDDRARIIGNWLGIDPQTGGQRSDTTRRAVVQTEVSRYDMIQSVFDLNTRQPEFNGNVPRLVPLIQFRPAHVDNEPAEGQVAVRQGEETSSAEKIAPDVFRTEYALWERPIVRNWPTGWMPGDPDNNQYSIMRGDISQGDPNGITGSSIFVFDPDVNQDDTNSGTEVFDATLYDRLNTSGGNYPFTQAALAANVRTGWLSSPILRSAFVPYVLNTRTGKIITSFGIFEIGDPNFTLPAGTLNLPTKLTTDPNTDPTTPQNDPDVSGNFYDVRHDPINEKFNKVWADAPNLQPNIHRFIDLRVTPNTDGTVGPLDPVNGFARATIVPGSDEVYGPDQLPGAHYGSSIRYTRVTGTPGPNQYKINYVDLNEPSTNGVVDYQGQLGLTPAQVAGFNPFVYDPQNFCSAVIQPRYKKGYVQLNSDPTVALPKGDFKVSYRFQFNGSGNRGQGYRQDVFAVDYDTRQLINVLLTMRNYPQATNLPNPQTVTLKSTAAVRNYIR